MLSIEISGKLEKELLELCDKMSETPKHHIKKALQYYFEDLEDSRIADKAYQEFVESREETIPLEEIKKKYDL